MNEVSITINGTRYELMPEDDTYDICAKCDLKEYCDKAEGTTLCAIFGIMRFEVFKAVKDIIKDNPEDKGNLKVQIEFVDGSSRCYHIGSLDDIIAHEWVTIISIDGVKETINTKNIKTIREAKFV